VTEVAIREAAAERMGFFTDTTVCIGCKACEVACKQWNDLPGDGSVFGKRGSYDSTGALSASTWRHVRFVESVAEGEHDVDLIAWAESQGVPQLDKWLFMSDVCKHCTNAGCLDACPTGALVRTEHETVVLQADVCNGCGYCVPACPFGVVDRDPDDGRAGKCTLCYDRLEDGLEPACAKACPTDSIQFGELDELRERADARLEKLQAQGWNGAQLYGRDPDDGVGGFGAFFLLLDEPEVYGLPPDPVVTTRDLPSLWKTTAIAAAATVVGTALAFLGGRA